MIWLKLLSLLFISPIPLLWELKDDAPGDIHGKGNKDMIYRSLLCFLSGALTTLIIAFKAGPEINIFMNIARYTLCTAGIFIALFSYLVNYVHLKRGVTHYTKWSMTSDRKLTIDFKFLTDREIFDHVVNHMNKNSWPDTSKFWNKIRWQGRAIVHLIIISISIILWFM